MQRTLYQLYASLAATCISFQIRWSDMNGAIQLTDDDIAFLINLLRSSGLPMTTQQLIDALRERGAQG